jgi:hypothetical protein
MDSLISQSPGKACSSNYTSTVGKATASAACILHRQHAEAMVGRHFSKGAMTMIDTKFSRSRDLLNADELTGMRELTSDEIADITGGVVVCYGPSPRPHPGPHDGAPYVPPGYGIP